MTTVNVLMVAEKPLLAESITKILSDGEYRTRQGLNDPCKIHEFGGDFRGQTAHFKVTSTLGHVFVANFSEKYRSRNWESTNPLDLFYCDIEKRDAKLPKVNQLKLPKVNQLKMPKAKGCHVLVLWLDCDKEGENICFEVIALVQNALVAVSGSQFMENVFRAKFSSLSEIDIKKAMNNLVKPNRNVSRSVDALKELDLRIGCAFTRIQFNNFHKLFSFGPCQTPTLAFCVKRHHKIQKFKPTQYWDMNIQIELPGGRLIKLDWKRGRQTDRNTAQYFLKKLKEFTTAKVIAVSLEENVKEKPVALNSLELYRICSTNFGFSPMHSMEVAQKLYMRGYSSYPRSETTSYPESFNFESILANIAKTKIYGEIAEKLLIDGISMPKKGADKGDHPPITPLDKSGWFFCHPNWVYEMAIDPRATEEEVCIYNYITRHFLATVMPDCTYKKRTATFSIGNEIFTAQSASVLDPGFTAVMTWQAISEGEQLDGLLIGQEFAIRDMNLVEKVTTPPTHLTEAELITKMEKHGIGTDGSVPGHVEKLNKRNFVEEVKTGRELIPTKYGIEIIRGYQAIDKKLVDPEMRAYVEKQLELIANGQAAYTEVTQQILQIFKQKYVDFLKKIDEFDLVFEAITPCLSKCLGEKAKGKLLLDPQSGPEWKLSCTKCPAVVGIFEGASSIRVLEEECMCRRGRKKVYVEYKDAKSSKLPNRALTYSGCAFCDKHVKDCINLDHAFPPPQPKPRPASAMSGGGGRGGDQAFGSQGQRGHGFGSFDGGNRQIGIGRGGGSGRGFGSQYQRDRGFCGGNRGAGIGSGSGQAFGSFSSASRGGELPRG